MKNLAPLTEVVAGSWGGLGGILTRPGLGRQVCSTAGTVDGEIMGIMGR